MSTQFNLDERLRRVIVTVMPGPQTTTVAKTVVSLVERRPELRSWDWIIDLRNPHEKAAPEELERIAAAFNGARNRRSYTVFVSDDPAIYGRCALMERTLPDRRHIVAKTMAGAHALLPWTMPGL